MMPCQTARRLRQEHSVTGIPTDEQIDATLDAVGLTVIDFPFAPGINEVIIDNYVGLRIGLSRRWRRWLKLHALAHRLFDDGNQFYLLRQDSAIVAQQENRAELFTVTFLLDGLDRRECQDAYSVARAAEVPERCVRRWWDLYGQYQGVRQPLDSPL